MNISKPIKPYSEPEEDRISALPDQILIHILSFLPTKQFIQAATLSKRWQFLWFSASSLIFHFDGDCERSYYFIDFVATTLMFHNVPKINKFSVKMNDNWICRTNCITTVNNWIRFAVVKFAEEIHVHLNGEKYTLPKQLYKNDRVRVMSFKGCNLEISMASSISWGSLETLTITESSGMTKQMVRKILDGCPKIVCLDVIDSYDPDRGCEVNHHYEYIRVKS